MEEFCFVVVFSLLHVVYFNSNQSAFQIVNVYAITQPGLLIVYEKGAYNLHFAERHKYFPPLYIFIDVVHCNHVFV